MSQIVDDVNLPPDLAPRPKLVTVPKPRCRCCKSPTFRYEGEWKCYICGEWYEMLTTPSALYRPVRFIFWN